MTNANAPDIPAEAPVAGSIFSFWESGTGGKVRTAPFLPCVISHQQWNISLSLVFRLAVMASFIAAFRSGMVPSFFCMPFTLGMGSFGKIPPFT